MTTTRTRSMARIREGRLFLISLKVSFGRLSLWLSVGVLLALLSFAVAMPTYSWFESLGQSRMQPSEQFGSLSTVFRQDHGEGLAQLNRSTAGIAAVMTLLAWLLGIFVAGGWLQVTLERTQHQLLRRFFVGGARHFWRFLRLALLVLLVLGVFRWVLYDAPFKELVLRRGFGVPETDLLPGRNLESFDSEATRDRIYWLRDGLMALLFMLTLAWGVFTRTRLALSGSRSVLIASGLTLLSIVRHPLRTLAPLFGLFLVEVLILVAVIGSLSTWVNTHMEGHHESLWVWILLALGLIGLFWREISRGARYHAAVVVSKSMIRASAHANPWQSIGGPGGPQYPVSEGDDDDRFGVSM
ncbi:MAG: hypothetical protein JKY61_02880 [Planctomycetes bacterium]|nr:hypothetical protein [Planctomycetota bacterium]